MGASYPFRFIRQIQTENKLIIIITTAETAIILLGLATANEGEECDLLFTASQLVVNPKRIYNLQYMGYSAEKTLTVAWLNE